MRYGTIITDAFYGIGLSKRDIDLVDGFFLGASHHRFRAINALTEKDRVFHSSLYWQHIQAMMKVIAMGDFSNVFRHDSVTRRGHHRPAGWLKVMEVHSSMVADPRHYDHLLPSDSLFDLMGADIRHPAGRKYPYDVLLVNPKILPSQIPLEPSAA